MMQHKVFSTGIYLRLSREDGDRSESDSIQNQRRLTTDFVDSHDELVLTDEYTDDGYTGTDFERPAFRRMIEDIKRRRIDCVVVKDLSRFGREYIGVGRYLEQMFVDYGVRFIAINDNVDSLDGQYDIIVPIKNLFNAQYALDISKKVQSSFKAKQRSGEFVGAFASYGYRKSESDRHALVIDEYAAAVVRSIFDMFLGGMGKSAIAKKLNEDGILCPSAYKRISGLNYTNCNRLDRTTYWTYSSICRILENQMYLGNMVQGKTRRRMKGRAVQVDKSEWIVAQGTHEPIISSEKWDRVQTLLGKETRAPNFCSNVNLFAGFLKCGDCGRAMCKRANNGRVSFSCGSYTRYGSSICSPHRISFDVLEAAILNDINKLLSKTENLPELVRNESGRLEAVQLSDSEPGRITDELDRLQSQKLALYGDFRDELISRKEYILLREQYSQREALLKQKLETATARQSTTIGNPLDTPWFVSLTEHRRITELDREMLSELIEAIYVYEGNKIEIVYRFESNEADIAG